MDWTPIRRTGPPEAEEIDDRADRVLLSFPLSESPPQEWNDQFEASHMGHEYPPLEVRGRTIRVWSRRSQRDVEAWAGNIDRDIKLANKYYMETVLVERQRREDAERATEERLRQQLEEARGWTSGLEPHDQEEEA